MTFSGHIAMTALVLSATRVPLLVIPTCWVLHLVADAIPHAEWQPLSQASVRTKVIMATDLVATIVLTTALYVFLPAPPWLISAAILASLLPDLTDQLARRYARPFRWVHELMHTWPLLPISPVEWDQTVTGRTPASVKVAIQIALVVITGIVLIHQKNS